MFYFKYYIFVYNINQSEHMKQISDHFLIKTMNQVFNVFFIAAFVISIAIISYPIVSPPKASDKIQERNVEIIEKFPPNFNPSVALGKWFNDKIVVSKNDRYGVVYINLKDKQPSYLAIIVLQVLKYLFIVYFLAIFYLLKRVLNDFCRHEIFNKKNINRFGAIGLLFITIPFAGYLKQELFLKYIEGNNLNQTLFRFENGVSLVGWELFIGLIFLLFTVIFKAARDIQIENESFI